MCYQNRQQTERMVLPIRMFGDNEASMAEIDGLLAEVLLNVHDKQQQQKQQQTLGLVSRKY